MRGKKEDFDPLYSSANIELVDDNSIDDYDNDFFEKLQNERRLLNEFGQIYGLDTQLPNEFNSEQQDFNKRAPSVGFYGMRGKRDYFDDSEDETLFEDKQADDGFVGMQMDEKGGYSSKYYLIDIIVGMRGKKDVSDVIGDEKRAPGNAGFFGMRGKKAPLVTSFNQIRLQNCFNKINFNSQLAFSAQEAKKVHLNSEVNSLVFVVKRYQMDR